MWGSYDNIPKARFYLLKGTLVSRLITGLTGGHDIAYEGCRNAYWVLLTLQMLCLTSTYWGLVSKE